MITSLKGEIEQVVHHPIIYFYIYHYMGFQDFKQEWHQINVSLLKTVFVLLHPTRDYFNEYGKSIFDTDKNTECSVYNNQKVNNEFEIDNIKYC